MTMEMLRLKGFCAALMLSAAWGASAVTLVEDGRACSEVVVPADALAVEKYAAEELVRYIRKSTGVELPVVVGASRCANRILIGRAAGLGELPMWDGKVVAEADVLKIAGGDSRHFTPPVYGWPCGTLYAVYEFLDRELHLRFLWPDEEIGTVIDRRKTVEVAPKAYGYRHPFENVSIRGFENDWLRRAARAVRRPVNYPDGTGGHAFVGWWKEYGETHPDFFEMIGGKRNPNPGASMCVANPAFHAEIVRRWDEARRCHPDVVYSINARENDTEGLCECPMCKAWNDPTVDPVKDASARYARYYGAVYDLAAKIDPEVRVYGYAYANYVNPPRGVTLPENVCISYVPEPLQPYDAAAREKALGAIRRWQKVGCTLNYRPNYLDGYAMPHDISTDYCLEFHEMCKAHMKEIDIDGPNLSFATQGPFLYMMSRLMVRPALTREELMDEYCAAFGPAKDAVRAYWEFWNRYALEHAKMFREVPEQRNPLFHTRNFGFQYAFYAHILFPEEVLSEGGRLLDRALKVAQGSPDDLRRVEFLKAGLEHAILCARTCAVCADENADNATRQKAMDAVKAFRETAPKWSFNPKGYSIRPWCNELAAWRLIDFDPKMTVKIPVKWRLRLDPKDEGVARGYWKADCDDASWDWVLTDRHLERQGINRGYRHAWYRTTVDVPEKFKGLRTEIRFGRVDDSCVVYVNGVESARFDFDPRKNPSSMNFPMSFDVTGRFRTGRNVIAVRLTNASGDGGLWQPVELRFSAEETLPLYEAAFRPGLEGFAVMNHGPFSVFEVKDFAGERNVLVVSKAKDATKGTAWEVRGARFPVTPGERLTVVVRARGTVAAMRYPTGFKGNFLTAVRWFDAAGKMLDRRRGFGFEAFPSEWRYSFATVEVPEGAATACVSLGADRPDFAADDFVAVSMLRVEKAADAAASAHRTSLRDDGVTLVDGKPFFPIGVYSLRKCAANGNSFEKAMADLKAAGFNTVQIVPNEPVELEDEFYAAVEKTGMMSFVPPARAFSQDIYAQGRVRSFRNRPSVLCWYLADDTATHAVPDEVAYRRRICRVLDGGAHLTMQADGVFGEDVNRYDPFVDATEVFMPEIYPCREPEATGAETAEVVRDMRTIRATLADHGSPTKGIWPILQGFDGWGNWKRFPSARELRAMTWAAIALGGKGLVWYAYASRNPQANHGIVHSPETWRRVTDVTREVAALADDLVQRDAAVQPQVRILSGPEKDAFGNPPVSLLLKDGASPLLIAVNSTTNAVKTAIKVVGFDKAKAMGENRELDVRKAFAEDFEPLGVHLYRLRK